ncbi:MAG: phenylalanine-4-hydroxylase, partial [Actinomycetota bacterium]
MTLSTPAQECDLPEDHPGFHDPAYRARRAEISRVGAAYLAGDPIPDVAYTPEEDEVWRLVSTELAAKHQQLACREVIDAAARVVLPVDRVPQLREVNNRVHKLTGFSIAPVPGLVPTRQFYGALADRTFLSTQYIRHHSVPRYTPEPDIVHEIIGHANSLGSARIADLYEAAGHASRRAESDAGLEFFSRVWWFTMEFGVVHEDGALKAYGAGLLSSFGEMDAFRAAEVRAWDLATMGTID